MNTKGVEFHFGLHPFLLPHLSDGQPDGLIAGFGFNNLLFELVEPLAGFEELAYQLVAAHEDASSGVLGGVARMDADALEEMVEVGAAEQDGKPHLELRTPTDYYGVTAFWDGEGLQLLSLRGRTEHGVFRDRCLQFEGRGFEGVAEVHLACVGSILFILLLDDGKPTYRVGLPFRYACQY